MADPGATAILREHALLLRALARAQRLCTEQQRRLVRAEAELLRARAAAILRTTEALWARERAPEPPAERQTGDGTAAFDPRIFVLPPLRADPRGAAPRRG